MSSFWLFSIMSRWSKGKWMRALTKVENGIVVFSKENWQKPLKRWLSFGKVCKYFYFLILLSIPFIVSKNTMSHNWTISDSSGSFPVIPPVLVAAAILPDLKATAPTVPIPWDWVMISVSQSCSGVRWLMLCSLSHSSRANLLSSVTSQSLIDQIWVSERWEKVSKHSSCTTKYDM